MKFVLKTVIFFLTGFSLCLAQSLRELRDLEPYKGVTVLQRKFLPKTKRFEFFLSGSNLMNDAFFVTAGLSAKAAYYFSEKYAIEGTAGLYGGFHREVVDDLKEKSIETKGFVTTRQYYGLDLKWVPIYGKLSYHNKRIFYYDIYFTSGMGLTQTNQDMSEPTFHVGVGQTFAMSKKWATRWDFSYNFYRGHYRLGGAEKTQNVSHLFLSIGLSVFLPEATYR